MDDNGLQKNILKENQWKARRSWIAAITGVINDPPRTPVIGTKGSAMGHSKKLKF